MYAHHRPGVLYVLPEVQRIFVGSLYMNSINDSVDKRGARRERRQGA